MAEADWGEAMIEGWSDGRTQGEREASASRWGGNAVSSCDAIGVLTHPARLTTPHHSLLTTHPHPLKRRHRPAGRAANGARAELLAGAAGFLQAQVFPSRRVRAPGQH